MKAFAMPSPDETRHPKPVIVISKCIEHAPCRYNGAIISDPFARLMKPFAEFMPVCPEEECGLGVPRDPVRIVLEEGALMLFQPASGLDHTTAMRDFTGAYLGALPEIDGFLLKSASPSCGIKSVKVYMGRESSSRTGKGNGMFADAVLRAYPDLPVEDEGRLRNFTIREHFLSSVFAHARFRRARSAGGVSRLVRFHTVHKLFLLSRSESLMRTMGGVVARAKLAGASAAFDEYGALLRQALSRQASFKAVINVLYHAFGGFKDVLDRAEKIFFQNSVEEYRDERIPLSVLTHLLKGWAVKYGNEYLLEQTFMEPFPRELVGITDSGKGRDL